MRSGGFPCRMLGCGEAFVVADQGSMEALRESSAARTAHEISAHGYHHVRLPEPAAFKPYTVKRKAPDPRP